MSKFLSLEWFKSKIETAVEKAVEKVVSSKIENLMDEECGSDHDIDVKPYTKVKMVNDTLIIVLNSGEIISKSEATDDDFHKAKNAKTEDDLRTIVSCESVRQDRIAREKEVAKLKALQKGLSVLEDLQDFEVRGGSVYLKGINRSLPQLLVEKFIEVVDKWKNCPSEDLQDVLDNNDEYQGLKRFFMWCCLNPRAEVADSLYEFLMKNSFRITKQGFFAALRNVVTLHGSNELVQFVSNTYNKVKAVWKKSPDDYTVFLQDGEYKLVHSSHLTKTVEGWDDEFEVAYEYEEEINNGEKLGSLTELYLDLPNRHENRFTDDWTKTFDIRIGKVVNMPIDACNWSTQDCAAAGLHFTSDQIHYVGCGDQSVLVLINPMKVVGIGEHKGRCYEYLPIMTVPREEATELLHDMNFDVLALDEDFAIRELESLKEKTMLGFATEAKKYDFNIPSISVVEINNIVNSLDEMKKTISSRISIID